MDCKIFHLQYDEKRKKGNQTREKQHPLKKAKSAKLKVAKKKTKK